MSNTMWKYRPLDWILKATAYLPLRVLYVLADITFVLMYYIIRYRRKVVDKNIIDSFPEKSRQEQQQTIRRFYRHFADYFFETLKLHHISDDEMRRRMTFDNIELIDSLLSQGRSVVAYFSHCGNWEWATSITLWTNHQPEKECVFGQVYRPLKNDWFDQYFLHLRSRFNSRSFPKSSVLRDLIRLHRSEIPTVTGFMSDQKPSHNDALHVVRFLNRPTAVITGTEVLARKLNMAVVYMDMEKHSRGHYHITIRLITEHPEQMPELSITDTYTRMLEESIRRPPHIWLWSHKRWKHKVSLPPDYSEENAKTDSCNNS